jgi:NAD(P)-dependent dehydrogenase (short-subunit alcohol dehydrogenase family)
MSDRVVLITGGTGALGAAVALAVLEAGATAIVTYRDARDRDTLGHHVPGQ